MQTTSQPNLPAFLTWPLTLIPGPVHSGVLATALNILFADPIRTEEFEFLRERRLAIAVRDAKVNYQFRYTGRRGFVACYSHQKPDLTISGTAYDFMTLATRREDSDTLFFNRRVVMEGDTALGLELKNWLDGMDFAAISRLLPPLIRLTDSLLSTYDRFSGRNP